MDSSLGLLAAGLSAAANKTIEFTDDGGANAIALHKETTIRGRVEFERESPVFAGAGTDSARSSLELFPLWGLSSVRPLGAASPLPSPTASPASQIFSLTPSPRYSPPFEILIKPESGDSFRLDVGPSITIAAAKRLIGSKIGLQSDDYQLRHHQKLLRDDYTLERYKIKEGDQIDLVPKKKAKDTVFAVSMDALAPRFDFDFTKVKPPLWNSYKRGNEVYRRPYGWKRYALKVVGEFEDDYWLGGLGPRKKSSSGEWLVSYHGISRTNAESIAEKAYFLSMGQRFKFVEGIYSTPDLRIAERYAAEFQHEGKTYLIVLQNRVNPITLKKIKKADRVGTGEYWLNPEQSDVRPYGILIKEMK